MNNEDEKERERMHKMFDELMAKVGPPITPAVVAALDSLAEQMQETWDEAQKRAREIECADSGKPDEDGGDAVE